MRQKEMLIFARDKWEIAIEEINIASGVRQWRRRDWSYICDIGHEAARQNMPAKPGTKTTKPNRTQNARIKP